MRSASTRRPMLLPVRRAISPGCGVRTDARRPRQEDLRALCHGIQAVGIEDQRQGTGAHQTADKSERLIRLSQAGAEGQRLLSLPEGFERRQRRRLKASPAPAAERSSPPST